MLELINLNKQYSNGYEALSQINLKLEQGELAFLTGHSGAGKTTLLKIISALEAPTRGQVHVNGHDLMKIKRRDIPKFRQSIGIVLQDPHLVASHSAFENVALPLIIAGYSRTEIPKRVRAALDKVGLLKKENFKTEELSAGEQQRVGLARAIVARPTLLLADEPTGNLDPDLSTAIIKLFIEFNRLGTSVLIATHDIHLIHNLSYRVIHIEQGRTVEDML